MLLKIHVLTGGRHMRFFTSLGVHEHKEDGV